MKGVELNNNCLKAFFPEKGIKLNIPIYALMRNSEEIRISIRNWKNFTRNHFEFKILKGIIFSFIIMPLNW